MVQPSFPSFGWNCFPPSLLLGGAAWPPSFGGVVFPLSSVGWPEFFVFFFWVELLFPSPFAWCCFSSPLLGGAAFPPLFHWLVLLGLFLLWLVLFFPSLFSVSFFPLLWVALFSPLFCWVVLAGCPFFLLPSQDEAETKAAICPKQKKKNLSLECFTYCFYKRKLDGPIF